MDFLLCFQRFSGILICRLCSDVRCDTWLLKMLQILRWQSEFKCERKILNLWQWTKNFSKVIWDFLSFNFQPQIKFIRFYNCECFGDKPKVPLPCFTSTQKWAKIKTKYWINKVSGTEGAAWRRHERMYGLCDKKKQISAVTSRFSVHFLSSPFVSLRM